MSVTKQEAMDRFVVGWRNFDKMLSATERTFYAAGNLLGLLKDEFRNNAEKISDLFRKNKISTIIAPRRSLKGQLRFANNMNAKLAVILGEDEIKNNSITVKFLNSRDSQIESQNEDILKIKSLLTSEE